MTYMSYDTSGWTESYSTTTVTSSNYFADFVWPDLPEAKERFYVPRAILPKRSLIRDKRDFQHLPRNRLE